MAKFKMAKLRLRLATALMLLSLIVLVIGCGVKETAKASGLPIGELSYTKIDLSTIAQLPPEIQKWYQEKFKTLALHSYTLNGERYLLLSAGEKRTGGYEIRDLMLTGTEKEIEVKAGLKAPAQDEIVAMALTYPHVLVKIHEDGRKLIFGGIAGNDSNTKYPGEQADADKSADKSTGSESSQNADVQRDLKTDSGRYTGQIDNNSIEVKISGTPDKVEARAFQLGAEVKEKFDGLGLKTNEEIKFEYYVDQYGRLVITEIQSLTR